MNSDDCWMTATRDANGNQVANPDKFPDGFKAVADYIHSLGLKSGLYTAKGPHTCGGFAASCDHEVQDGEGVVPTWVPVAMGIGGSAWELGGTVHSCGLRGAVCLPMALPLLGYPP